MGQPDIVVKWQNLSRYRCFLSCSLIVFRRTSSLLMGIKKLNMWATIIGNVINVVINYFLIYGIWIFPKMGIVGQLSVRLFLVLLCYFYALHHWLEIPSYFENFSLKEIKKKMLNKIINLGLPSSMQMYFFEVGLQGNLAFRVWNDRSGC
jgi:MATE family multidrug resistance protein